MKSCLNCVYCAGDPWSRTHKYCAAEPDIPACASMKRESIDPENPHTDCPIWQQDPTKEATPKAQEEPSGGPADGAFEAAVDNFQGACARFYCGGKHYGTEQAEMEFARARLFKLHAPAPSPRTPALEAVELLERIQWNGALVGNNCPSCGGHSAYGHTEKCKLAKVVARLRAAKAPEDTPAEGAQKVLRVGNSLELRNLARVTHAMAEAGAAPGTPIEAARGDVEKHLDEAHTQIAAAEDFIRSGEADLALSRTDRASDSIDEATHLLKALRAAQARPALEKAAREGLEIPIEELCAIAIRLAAGSNPEKEATEVDRVRRLLEAAKARAALSGLPQDPIERAAREYVEVCRRVAMSPGNPLNDAQDKATAWNNLCAAVDGSGLPQDPAARHPMISRPGDENWLRHGCGSEVFKRWNYCPDCGGGITVAAQGEPAAKEGEGEPLPTVGGPAGQKKGDE